MAYIVLATSALQYFAGIYYYVHSFCVDIRQRFTLIDLMVNQNKAIIEQELLVLVKFHIDILK